MNNKKVILAIGIGICLVIVGIIAVSYIWTPTHEEEWYNSSWEYRKPMTMSSEKSFTDYQVKLTIDLVHGMKGDCSDLRFTTPDGKTELFYWIENTTDSSATVWVKVPEIKAEEENKIYMYYGNNEAESVSNSIEAFDYERPHYLGGLGGYSEKVFVKNKVAFLANGYGGLYVYNISNVRSPSLLGICNTPGFSHDVFVDDRKVAYIADWDGGLRLINVDNPSNPTEISYIETPDDARRIFVDTLNNTVYVADTRSGVRIIDVSDPRSPYEVGYYNTHGFCSDVYVDTTNKIAYIADATGQNKSIAGGLIIIDVNNPGAPFEIGYLKTSDARSVEVDLRNKTAYVSDWVFV